MPKKPDPNAISKALKAGAPGKFLAKFPIVAGYLLDLTYEDDPDSTREPSGMFLKFTGGDLHCWFSDPSCDRQVKLVVPSFDELFPALEMLLAGNNCPWVERLADRPSQTRSRSKK